MESRCYRLPETLLILRVSQLENIYLNILIYSCLQNQTSFHSKESASALVIPWFQHSIVLSSPCGVFMFLLLFSVYKFTIIRGADGLCGGAVRLCGAVQASLLSSHLAFSPQEAPYLHLPGAQWRCCQHSNRV